MRMRYPGMLLAIALLLMTISACGSGGTAEPANEVPQIRQNGDIVIGLSIPSAQFSRWNRDKIAMEQYASSLGIRLIVRESGPVLNAQYEDIRELLTYNPSVLIIAPVVADFDKEILDVLESRGIPTISYDRLIQGSDTIDLYVSFWNYRTGVVQGRYIESHLDLGNVVVIRGPETDMNSADLYQGAMDQLAPHFSSGLYRLVADEVAADWKASSAYETVRQAYYRLNRQGQQNPAANIEYINAVLAPNDTTAGAAIRALDELQPGVPVIVTGQDGEISAFKRIASGSQSMTVFKDTDALARTAFDMAILLARGIQPPTGDFVQNDAAQIPAVLLEPLLVTADTYESMLDRYYPVHARFFQDAIPGN